MDGTDARSATAEAASGPRPRTPAAPTPSELPEWPVFSPSSLSRPFELPAARAPSACLASRAA
eukprot:1439127-Prymnesium_polylepis.1